MARGGAGGASRSRLALPAARRSAQCRTGFAVASSSSRVLPGGDGDGLSAALARGNEKDARPGSDRALQPEAAYVPALIGRGRRCSSSIATPTRCPRASRRRWPKDPHSPISRSRRPVEIPRHPGNAAAPSDPARHCLPRPRSTGRGCRHQPRRLGILPLQCIGGGAGQLPVIEIQRQVQAKVGMRTVSGSA